MEAIEEKFGKSALIMLVPQATFTKLSSISPAERQENGISFIQSGLLMYLMLTIFSLEADPKTKLEIQDYIGFNASDTVIIWN